MMRWKTQLPEELIASEILTRLPVISLMRFKCVCKSWYALFQNSNFITSHRVFQQNNHSRVLVNGVKCGELQAFSILSDETLELQSYLIPFPPDVGATNYDTLLLGSSSVNGIICVLVKFTIPVILNPATREFKVIPPSYPFDQDSRILYGFGYDPITDDYKVVRNVRIASEMDSDFVEVYSLRSDCWRKLDAVVKCRVNHYSCNVLLNEMFYWMARDDSSKMLLSFDMSSELFYTTYLPDLDDTKKRQEIVSLKGSITMFTFGDALCSGRWFDIWTLGKVGVKESWTKHFTISLSLETKKPFGVGKNGEIFFLKYWYIDATLSTESDGEMECYDLNTRMFRNLGFKLCRWTPAVAIYSGSLVSLMKNN